MIKLDDYVLDTLMRDLVGHDRRSASFLVYLWLAGEQQRRKSAVSISYSDLAESGRGIKKLRASGDSMVDSPQTDFIHQGQCDRNAELRGANSMEGRSSPQDFACCQLGTPIILRNAKEECSRSV
jgi:hypothetical protein